LTRLGIEATGDPFWAETLRPDQLEAVYGLLYAEDLDAREAVASVRPSRPTPPPPANADAGAWTTLMSMRAR
jgi:hypothetical protein